MPTYCICIILPIICIANNILAICVHFEYWQYIINTVILRNESYPRVFGLVPWSTMVNSIVYKNVNHYYHLIPLLYYGTTRVLLFKAILLTILYLYLTIDSSNL